ncbi:hypothetical protein CMV_010252 [Castanea mollissima]|uniref:Aminotransferase-like plant mobile domain-containing protein n=1 Tax=Castanea mollissima TaxID=60419 RepID=A0A8J4RFR0_9ROSI|nr:hypothetical protein CMV_010252 [Castanea mollissima]
MWVLDYRSSWLVGQISDHWLGLLLVWASDCKVFCGSGFVDVVVDDLIRWWCFAGLWVSSLLLGFDLHVLRFGGGDLGMATAVVQEVDELGPIPMDHLVLRWLWVISTKNSPVEIYLVHYYQLLNSMHPNQVVWQPYEGELGHLLVSSFTGREMWMLQIGGCREREHGHLSSSGTNLSRHLFSVHRFFLEAARVLERLTTSRVEDYKTLVTLAEAVEEDLQERTRIKAALEQNKASNWWVTRTRTRTLELLWYKSLASSVFSAQVLLGSSESIRGGKILTGRSNNLRMSLFEAAKSGLWSY